LFNDKYQNIERWLRWTNQFETPRKSFVEYKNETDESGKFSLTEFGQKQVTNNEKQDTNQSNWDMNYPEDDLTMEIQFSHIKFNNFKIKELLKRNGK
jgi:5-formaminoimidazole-4-carboxamide-1-beta-D-ribofuranosyl 5'-monophosphate synthetase